MIENVIPHILYITIVRVNYIAIFKNEALSVFFPSTYFIVRYFLFKHSLTANWSLSKHCVAV